MIRDGKQRLRNFFFSLSISLSFFPNAFCFERDRDADISVVRGRLSDTQKTRARLRARERREVVSVRALFSLYAESIKRVFFCHRKKMRILKEEKEFRVYGFGRKKCPTNYRGRRRTKDTTASSPREKETKRARDRGGRRRRKEIQSAKRERATTETKKRAFCSKKKAIESSLSLSMRCAFFFSFFFSFVGFS